VSQVLKMQKVLYKYLMKELGWNLYHHNPIDIQNFYSNQHRNFLHCYDGSYATYHRHWDHSPGYTYTHPDSLQLPGKFVYCRSNMLPQDQIHNFPQASTYNRAILPQPWVHGHESVHQNKHFLLHFH